MSAPPDRSGNGKSLLEHVREDNTPVVRHAIGMAIVILCMWGFHLLLKATLGEEAKLYGYVPIIYVAHTGDTLAFLRFFWRLFKDLQQEADKA